MSEHFIKNIEIKKFKCFEEFKAEGFGRVNLIGGKNNVGKTAFMEACYIVSNYSHSITQHKDFKKNYGARDIDKEWITFEIIKSLIVIQQNRESIDFLTEWIKEELQLLSFNKTQITMNDRYRVDFVEDYITPRYKYKNWAYYDIDNTLAYFRENRYFHTIYKKNNPPQIINTIFISPYNQTHLILGDMIDTLKLTDRYNQISQILKDTFNIDKIDIIRNKVMCYTDKSFKDINYFGHGLKHFLHIVLTILTNSNRVVFIDEIENGIHYSNLDKLWELILKISKKQNIQLFATTHSKESIESYARVAKELKYDEIRFIELGRNDENQITSIIYDFESLIDQIEQYQEIRGW